MRSDSRAAPIWALPQAGGAKVSRESSGAAQPPVPGHTSLARPPTPPRQLVRVVCSTHGVRPSRANRERLRAQFKLRRRLGRALRVPALPVPPVPSLVPVRSS